MERHNPLHSHAPLTFAAKPELRQDTTPYVKARLLFKAHINLEKETARQEPRLRLLLGHISVHDGVNASTRKTPDFVSTRSKDANELQHQVPSFEAFRAALLVQIQTITQIRLQAIQQSTKLEEYNSDEEDDSDYDSYEGDLWSDDDSKQSDDSSTDNESDGQSSPTTPTFSIPPEYSVGKEEWPFPASKPCVITPPWEPSLARYQ